MSKGIKEFHRSSAHHFHPNYLPHFYSILFFLILNFCLFIAVFLETQKLLYPILLSNPLMFCILIFYIQFFYYFCCWKIHTSSFPPYLITLRKHFLYFLPSYLFFFQHHPLLNPHNLLFHTFYTFMTVHNIGI